MSEEEKKPEGEAEGAEGEASTEVAPKKSSKLPIILAATVPVLVIILVQVGLFYAGVFDKMFKHPAEAGAEHKEGDKAAAGAHGEAKTDGHGEGKKEEGKPAKSGDTIFHNLPDMLVNMMQDQDRINYLKLKVVLEVANKEIVDKLQKELPRVLDTIQVYVRELRVEDLKNSAGVEKFRQEILKRLNLILDSKDIIDVYFPTMVTQ